MMAAFNADAGCQIGLEAVAAGWLADVVHRSRIGERGSLNPQRPTRGAFASLATGTRHCASMRSQGMHVLDQWFSDDA